LVGWFFEMYMVTGAKIAAGGLGAWGFLAIAALTLMFSIPALTRKSRIYERIISGAAIALIGFGIFASFGRGYQPFGLALAMGLALGVILGLFISVRRRLDGTLGDTYTDAGVKPKERKVTEI